MANNEIFTEEEKTKIDDALSIVLKKIFFGDLENEKEDSAPKSSTESGTEPIAADDDFIIYVKKDNSSFINGTAIEVMSAINCIIRQLSDKADIPSEYIVEMISTADKLAK